jgi:myo-inositol 2-dehydrogenase/D-chiro-inositol 1-dehydrogenase
VTAHLENGAMAVISGTRVNGVGYDVRMEVFGTADSIAVGLDPHTPIDDGRAAPVGAAASRKAAVEQRPVFIEVIG